MSFFGYIKKCFREGTQISQFNVTWGAILAAPGNIFFYFLLKYVFHMEYESLGLRLAASDVFSDSGQIEFSGCKKVFSLLLAFFYHFRPSFPVYLFAAQEQFSRTLAVLGDLHDFCSDRLCPELADSPV